MSEQGPAPESYELRDREMLFLAYGALRAIAPNNLVTLQVEDYLYPNAKKRCDHSFKGNITSHEYKCEKCGKIQEVIK